MSLSSASQLANVANLPSPPSTDLRVRLATALLLYWRESLRLNAPIRFESSDLHLYHSEILNMQKGDILGK